MKYNKPPKSAVTALTIAVICPLSLTGAWAAEQVLPKTIETHFGEVTLDAKGYPDEKVSTGFMTKSTSSAPPRLSCGACQRWAWKDNS